MGKVCLAVGWAILEASHALSNTFSHLRSLMRRTDDMTVLVATPQRASENSSSFLLVMSSPSVHDPDSQAFSARSAYERIKSHDHHWQLVYVQRPATVASASAPRGLSVSFTSSGRLAVISRCAVMPAMIYGARNKPL